MHVLIEKKVPQFYADSQGVNTMTVGIRLKDNVNYIHVFVK